MSYAFPASADSLRATLTTARQAPYTLFAWQYRADWSPTTPPSTSLGVVQFSNDYVTSSPGASIIIPTTASNVGAIVRGTPTDDFSMQAGNFGITYDGVWLPLCLIIEEDTAVAGEFVIRTLYWDGSSNTEQGSGADCDTGSALDSVTIGDFEGTDSNNDGYVAEVAIWNKVLSTTEIDQLVTGSETGPAPNTVAPNNCIGYWSLDDNTTTGRENKASGTAADATGDLTINGTAAYNAEHPTITSSGPTITAAGNTSPLNETWTDGDTGIQIEGTGFV